MTRSQDRTLLSSLGFADVDKKDRRHYLACRFLAEEAQHRALLKLFVPSPRRQCWMRTTADNSVYIYVGSEPSLEWVADVDIKLDAEMESAISKGVAQYKTTIGFIDVLLSQHWRQTWRNTEQSRDWDLLSLTRLAVEVKINECGVDEILRQISLYKEHIGQVQSTESSSSRAAGASWIVVTAFRLSEPDVRALKNQGIGHVVLGKGFADYLAKADADGGSPEL